MVHTLSQDNIKTQHTKHESIKGAGNKNALTLYIFV